MCRFAKCILLLILFVVTVAGCTSRITDVGIKAFVDSSGFVNVSDTIPDVICEVRYYTTYNFVGQRIDGYEDSCILMTKQAATALKKVSDEVMSMGYRIKIYDAYRPQMAVDHFVRWASDISDDKMKHIFYPETEKSVLFDQGYIAAKSGHSRGSAIDLTLVDEITGKEIDMGSPFDYFGLESHIDYDGDLTQEQKNNRAILQEVMTKHGFKPIETEWWHFVLEDEPYPETYFNFSVNKNNIIKAE